MISISPTTYDLTGGLFFRELPSSDLLNTSRRLSRRALLDGSVSIYDGGYSDGDRTIIARFLATNAQADRAQSLMENYSLVTVSTRVGVYRCAIQSVNYSAPQLSITLLAESKRSE